MLELTAQANRLPRENRKYGSMWRACCVEMRDVAASLGISWRKVDEAMSKISQRPNAVIHKIGPYYSLALVEAWNPPQDKWDYERHERPSRERLGGACYVYDEERPPKKKRYSKRLQRRVA